MEAALAFLENQFGAEWVILGYLWYQFTFGKVSKLYDTIRSVIPVLMALTSKVDGVDEQAAAETLETDVQTPGQLLAQGGPYKDNEVERMEEIVNENN